MFFKKLNTTNIKQPLTAIKARIKLTNRDIPFHDGEDYNFLLFLLALMSFMAVLTCSGLLSLGAMTERWSSGLENKITIEVPAETQDGQLLSHDTVQKETRKAHKALSKHPNVRSADILTTDDIQTLISPWIGNELTLDDIPLPGLIAIELKNAQPEAIERLSTDLKNASPYARVETHHEWLADLIGFINTLKTIALLITALIIGTTITTVAVAMQTRLSIHKEEVELLHHMGATDSYIAGQFQNQASILSAKGSIIGTVIGLLITYMIVAISHQGTSSLLPSVQIGISSILIILSIPLLMTILSTITSRFTVLHSLYKMP